MSSKTCLNCRYLLSSEDIFCPECGSKYSEQDAQSASLPTYAESPQVATQTQSPSQYAHPVESRNQQLVGGQFLYKAVTFDSYMLDVLGDRRKEFAMEVSMSNSFAVTANYLNKKIVGLVDDMFNYYGRQGWEYWNQIDVPISRIREMAEISGNDKSALSFISAGIKKGMKNQLNSVDDIMPGVLTHYIFRKVAPK